jgi:hypothetical protein
VSLFYFVSPEKSIFHFDLFYSTQHGKPIYQQRAACPYFMMPVKQRPQLLLEPLAAEWERTDFPFFDLPESILNNYSVLAEVVIKRLLLVNKWVESTADNRSNCFWISTVASIGKHVFSG